MSDMERISRLMDDAKAAVTAMGPEHANVIAQIAELLLATFQAGGKLLLCGNGGSASDAQHIATELAGHFMHDRRPLPAIALGTDVSLLTCVANDYSYEDIFSRAVQALGRGGDVLWAISTSGNSPNVLKAAQAAKAIGMKVIGMTASGGGKLAALSDVCFKAPTNQTYLAQQVHQAAYHIVCLLLDEQCPR